MNEERFERIEDMLSQLIGMVAKTNERMDTSMERFRLEMKAMRAETKASISDLRSELKSDFSSEMKTSNSDLRSELKSDFSSEMKASISDLRSELKSDFSSEMKIMRTENDQRHQEIMQKFNDLEADQDYTWGKITRNEREITKLKEQQFGN